MTENVDAREYFLSLKAENDSEGAIYSRIANAIYAYGGINTVITMKQLCAMPEKELKMIRNIGSKARAVIVEECKNFTINSEV